MRGRCFKCGDQELVQQPAKALHHWLPQLGAPIEINVGFNCPNCGREVSNSFRYLTGYKLGPIQSDTSQANKVIRKHAQISLSPPNRKRWTTLGYPAAFRTGESVLFPTHEGNIQDGTLIDRYGDPDLVMDFAEQYCKQFRAILPKKRLPNGLSEFMPALLLLVVATELAIKAFLIRSGTSYHNIHSLPELYDHIECDQKKEIEKQFADSDSNSKLKRLGIECRTVKEILGAYDKSYGGPSTVYMDTRYFAEPTTKTFRQSSSLHGANLVKGNTPYPIFLPTIVNILIRTYRFFSGQERLRRLGANIQEGIRGLGNDNHGDWALIPATLNFVAISVSQSASRDSSFGELEVFSSFKAAHPPVFSTSWGYGGQTLLFYSDGGRSNLDGSRVINGLECKVRHKERLGMHSRDMYLLANALEDGSVVTGQAPPY